MSDREGKSEEERRLEDLWDPEDGQRQGKPERNRKQRRTPDTMGQTRLTGIGQAVHQKWHHGPAERGQGQE